MTYFSSSSAALALATSAAAAAAVAALDAAFEAYECILSLVWVMLPGTFSQTES